MLQLFQNYINTHKQGQSILEQLSYIRTKQKYILLLNFVFCKIFHTYVAEVLELQFIQMGKDYSTEKYYLGLVPLLVKNYLKISPVVHLTSQRNASFRRVCETHNLNCLLDLTFQLLLPGPLHFSIEEISLLTNLFLCFF